MRCGVSVPMRIRLVVWSVLTACNTLAVMFWTSHCRSSLFDLEYLLGACVLLLSLVGCFVALRRRSSLSIAVLGSVVHLILGTWYVMQAWGISSLPVTFLNVQRGWLDRMRFCSPFLFFGSLVPACVLLAVWFQGRLRQSPKAR